MPEDNNILLAIKEQLGALDAKVTDLKDDMNTICNFKEEVGKITQDFINYKATRQDLPARIITLEARTIATDKAIADHIIATAWISEKVAKSDTYFKAAMIAWGIVVSAVGLLITFHQYFGITFVTK